MQWHSSLPELQMQESTGPIRSTIPATDVSGDELDSDSNQTIDSLDTHFNGMRWDSSQTRRSLSSLSSSEENLYSFGVPPVTAPNWQVPALAVPALQQPQSHGTSQVSSFQPDLSAEVETGISGMFDRPTQPEPSRAGSAEENQGINSSFSVPSMNVESLAPSLCNQTPSSDRRPSGLARLSTKGLQPGSLQLSIPQTPSHFGNLTMFSPGHSALMMGNMDLSSWLDDRIVPSPLYELGACTGWSGLISATDTSKTPTAYTTRVTECNALKGPQPSSGTQMISSGSDVKPSDENIVDSDNTMPISPVLISSEDWWSRDSVAQWRFHRYILTTVPMLGWLRSEDCRTTLAMSAISRFMAYCSFLCLAEPDAPQPPFLHRQLLLKQRNKLPESLAIARCVLAALKLRLPSSDTYAWIQVAQQLERQIQDSHDTIVQINMYTGPREIVQRMLHFDGIMHIMAQLQTLWFYIVVGAFGESFDKTESRAFTLSHRIWDASLLPKATEALQQLTHIAATLGLMVQRLPAAEGMRNMEADDDTRDFLWWSLCESLRRTILAAYSLLILLRFVLHITQNDQAPELAVLGYPPFPSTTYGTSRVEHEKWSNVMELDLPAVADAFEADRAGVWRSHLDNHQPMGNAKLTLALFNAHRPLKKDEERTEMQFYLDSYFHQHDEFTNVCLSVVFGLSQDFLPTPT